MNAQTAEPPDEAKRERRDPYRVVTDMIISHLERGTAPWRCPWSREVGRPRNFHTGKTYRGVNQLLLGWRRFASPFWLTFRQVKNLGGSVRRGERGTPVVKYGTFNPKAAEGDEPERRRTAYFLREYFVFNAVQVEGVEFPAAPTPSPLPAPRRVEVAAAIVANMPQPPVIVEGQRSEASYEQSTDTVFMPPFGSFESGERYYLTLFHELAHATGHASRLARKSLLEHDGFGGKAYSQEELVAEMGAAFLGMEADIVQDEHGQSAAYIKSWLDALREPEHVRWLVLAGNQAAKAADFVLAVGQPAPSESAPAES
jgi:antirestriction protein ArdC